MIHQLGLRWRRDRVTLPIWILAISGLVLLTTVAVTQEFGTERDRAGLLAVALATPSLLALRGAPNGADVGATVFFVQFAFTAVAVGLMNTFFATRHGRADEERGRRELVGAAPVSRWSGLVATLVLGLVADLVLGALCALAFVAGGLDVTGAIVGGSAYAVTGLVFLGVAALAGEIVGTSRAANGVGAAAVLLAYALRAAGDALGTPDLGALRLTSAWPSWASPIGWGQQTFAFSENAIAPLLLGLGLAVVTAGLALVLHSRREIGESSLPERRGRAKGRRILRSNLGLVWRLQWPSLAGWTVGAILLGLAVASLATAIADASNVSEAVRRVLESLGRGNEDMTAIFVSAIMSLVGILAAAAGIQAVLRLRAEEADGRAELVLAAPVSRPRWSAAALTAGILSVVVVVVGTAAASAAAFALSGDGENAARSVGQALVEIPAALVFVTAASVLVAIAPRIAVAAAWGVFALGVAIGLFGELLGLPDPIVDASPISHVPVVPVDDAVPTLALAGIAIVLAAVATIAVRRRDLAAG